MVDYRQLRQAIQADYESPMRDLRQAQLRAGVEGPRRLDALANAIAQGNGDAETIEAFLVALLAWKSKQVGGSICLAETFRSAVKDIDPKVRKALPGTFGALVRLVEDAPVRMDDPRLLAHALMLDGQLASLLRAQSSWRQVLELADGGLEDARKAYRRLRRKHHPDSGGDSEQFHRIQTAWNDARAELG